MALENPAFEDVFPFETWGILHCHVSFRGCNLFFFFFGLVYENADAQIFTAALFPITHRQVENSGGSTALTVWEVSKKTPRYFRGHELESMKNPGFCPAGKCDFFP